MIMFLAVAPVFYQEYTKDEILTHVLVFLSLNLFLFYFLLQCSDLAFWCFILYLNCDVAISEAYSERCQHLQWSFLRKQLTA